MKKVLITTFLLVAGTVISLQIAKTTSANHSVMKKNDTYQPDSVVRPAAQADRFYEADPRRLADEVDDYLARHQNPHADRHVAAIIAPHAGYYFSGNVAAAAYMALNPQKPYKRIFMLGPSHYEWLDGASVNYAADYYATPLGLVPVDGETGCKLVEADSLFRYVPAAHDREHCLEVQLPFLQRRLHQVPPIVPIVVGTDRLDKLRGMAKALKPYFNDENLFVISSDFSHYPSYADARKVDAKTAEAILTGDVEKFMDVLQENAQSGCRNLATSACGAAPITILLLMLEGQGEIEHLLYQNSGDIDNYDHSRVVGYHAFAVYRNAEDTTAQEGDFNLSQTEKAALKSIARNSIESAFGHTSSSTPSLSPTLLRKCGAFVTLHKHGRLRGCIGHFGEDEPLHEMVAEMARAAAFEDPRFEPLKQSELDDIDIEISVLTPMRRIYSIDEFKLHKHGIYIRKGWRSGTFLPQVADEVDWTKEEFLGHCSRDKAGLGWEGWRDAELYVYEAIVF